jgi:hypothetical protein
VRWFREDPKEISEPETDSAMKQVDNLTERRVLNSQTKMENPAWLAGSERDLVKSATPV